MEREQRQKVWHPRALSGISNKWMDFLVLGLNIFPVIRPQDHIWERKILALSGILNKWMDFLVGRPLDHIFEKCDILTLSGILKSGRNILTLAHIWEKIQVNKKCDILELSGILNKWTEYLSQTTGHLHIFEREKSKQTKSVTLSRTEWNLK